MSGSNLVRRLGRDVFKNAGLLNLQRIFMSDCGVQVRLEVTNIWSANGIMFST